MSFEIKNNNITDFENTIHKEWALTNGIGGYAGGSVNGALSRTHHGYLIASYHPPSPPNQVICTALCQSK